jgi:hypothetical protein
MFRILFLIVVSLYTICLHGQTDVTTSYNPPHGVGYKTAVFEDTLRNRLFFTRYSNSGSTHWELFKTNLSNGTTTSLANFGSNNGIPFPTSVIKYAKNRIVLNRKVPASANPNYQIASFDTTGSLLWSLNLSSGEVITDMVYSLTGDTLFVAGDFYYGGQVSLLALNSATGQQIPGWGFGTDITGNINTLLLRGAKLYAGGNFSYTPYLNHNNIIRISLNVVNGAVDNGWKPNPNGEVFDMALVAPLQLAIGGAFTSLTPISTAIPLNRLAYVHVNTNTVQTTNTPSFNNTVRQIIVYRNTSVYFVAGDFTTINSQTVANVAQITYQNSLSNWLPIITDYHSTISLSCFRNRLYINTSQTGASFNSYRVYCLAPQQPSAVYINNLLPSVTPVVQCSGSGPFNLSVNGVPDAVAYNWSYSGTGATIVANGNTAIISFGLNATSGTVQVFCSSFCGEVSALRTLAYTINPTPVAIAPPNDTLSCIVNSVTLNGITPSPNTSLTWLGPNSQSFVNPVNANVPGAYILNALSINGCSSSDTAYVLIDTIPPVVQPFGTVNDLTCTTDTVWLDAAALYPGDSLRWNTLQGVFPNPYAATLSGNYLLYIHKRSNGCESSDTIFVNQNTTPPPVLLPASIDTLTCLLTAVQLNSPPVTGGLQIWNLVGDTVFLNNPVSVTVPGNYILTTTSLINGCTSQGVVNVNQFITPPNVTVPVNVPVLNCSFDSVAIDGSSANIGAGLWWTGPGNFSAADPAVVTQPGVYVLTVTHPQNGCTRSDSVTVNYVNTLTVIASADTAICPGSGAVLSAAPVGGTPGFSIAWSSNGGSGSPVTVYPGDTLTYTVTINDNAGCIGTDSVTVNVPDVLSDSTLSFQPCDPLQPTGQVQVYAWGGVPPYQYSIDGGSTFQNSGVFGNLGYGNYSFIIRDTLGCTRSTFAVIDTNSLSPAPDFLLSTNPDMGDTVVIIDISNPRPDSVNWIFPPSVTVIDSNQFAPVILYGDTGSFTITMQAYYGSCEVNYVRNVIIGPFVPGGASPWNNNGIDTLIVYPNPNNGTFTVDLQLHAEQTFVIQVFDANGIERFRMPPLTADNWNGSITIPGALPGNYQLRVTAEFDSESRIIIVTQ